MSQTETFKGLRDYSLFGLPPSISSICLQSCLPAYLIQTLVQASLLGDSEILGGRYECAGNNRANAEGIPWSISAQAVALSVVRPGRVAVSRNNRFRRLFSGLPGLGRNPLSRGPALHRAGNVFANPGEPGKGPGPPQVVPLGSAPECRYALSRSAHRAPAASRRTAQSPLTPAPET